MPPSEAGMDYFQETITKPQNVGKLLVAEVEGSGEGVAFYETMENGSGDIGVFVSKDYRGQKIGSRLLEELIARTDNSLEVTIFAFNKSRGLYKQFGFMEEGGESIHYFDDTTYLPVQRLVLHRD